MSLPTEADFAIIRSATVRLHRSICHRLRCIQDVDDQPGCRNADRFSRDCTKPGEILNRKVKATGKSPTLLALA